jgi:hypothetical protein
LLRQETPKSTPHISTSPVSPWSNFRSCIVFTFSGICTAVRVVWSDYLVTFCL